MTTDDDQTVPLLQEWYAVSSLIERSVNKVFNSLGVNETTGALLWALDPEGEAPTVREVAAILDCDPSNASLVSTKMVRDGLVKRKVHPRDGRARVLELTDEGVLLRNRLLAGIWSSVALSSLSTAQQRELSAILQVLRDA